MEEVNIWFFKRVEVTMFEGITVGLFETRRKRELSAMFAARGAQVVACPLIFPESHGVEEPVREFIEQTVAGKFAVAVFYTGIGIEAVLDAARQLGSYEALRDAFTRMTVIARGPKGKGALKRHNLTPNFLAQPPTTQGLIKLAEGLDVRGKRVAIGLAGDQPSSALSEAVKHGGGEVYEFAPYHYHLPEDLSEIGAFIGRVLAREINLLAFTTPPQVTILMDAAGTLGSAQELLQALNTSATVAAVGTVTAGALARYGVKVSVRPPEDDETMMGLVEAIEAFFRK
jgi:uroporphyrinogen-III synthase